MGIPNLTYFQCAAECFKLDDGEQKYCEAGKGIQIVFKSESFIQPRSEPQFVTDRYDH